ncbi:hypothetical protein [Agrobacterium larrymoorei]|uniref:Uncharacterized protein n=1 Tax=Agrobacterium larrymoorei TaxID=160699 RepID=A0ABX8T244_9HYPH|nr:hypothetical protein [Agrobacterium larrymoorei]QYA07307.1 hypothetical protein J5285_00805 [Agrobacterium larrymoorei]
MSEKSRENGKNDRETPQLIRGAEWVDVLSRFWSILVSTLKNANGKKFGND